MTISVALLWASALACLMVLSRCAPPEDISNFQNEYVCDTHVRLVRPLSVLDVKKAVKRHARVKALGTGHSWNGFYCASPPEETEDPSDTSTNIAMTTIRPLEIEVNANEWAVWASAAITVWDLILYLSKYTTAFAPRGYYMLATPSGLNQTIAGAIATNTHGSSLEHGSLSHQLLAVKVVLANGTLVEISEKSHPFLMKAFRVNVGRLGVVTHVKMRIFSQTPARRTLRSAIPSNEFMNMFNSAQEMYRTTGTLPEWLESANIWWAAVNEVFEMYTYRPLPETIPTSKCHGTECDIPDSDSMSFLEELEQTKINAPVNLSRAEDSLKVADGVEWEMPTPLPINMALINPNVTAVFENQTLTNIRSEWKNATVETHEAIYALREGFAAQLDMTLHDNYAVAVPVSKMADCIQGAKALMDSLAPDNGLRTTILLRFVGKEDGFLSMSNAEPQLVIDVFDLVYYHQENRSSNLPFKEMFAFFVTSPLCSPARLHWGKSGWPDSGCWNGADVYKEAWCDFGCAVLELDPLGKFVGPDPNLWNWKGANLEDCCTPDGYDTSKKGCRCEVDRIRSPDECPEAPFYTNR